MRPTKSTFALLAALLLALLTLALSPAREICFRSANPPTHTSTTVCPSRRAQAACPPARCSAGRWRFFPPPSR